MIVSTPDTPGTTKVCPQPRNVTESSCFKQHQYVSLSRTTLIASRVSNLVCPDRTATAQNKKSQLSKHKSKFTRPILVNLRKEATRYQNQSSATKPQVQTNRLHTMVVRKVKREAPVRVYSKKKRLNTEHLCNRSTMSCQPDQYWSIPGIRAKQSTIPRQPTSTGQLTTVANTRLPCHNNGMSSTSQLKECGENHMFATEENLVNQQSSTGQLEESGGSRRITVSTVCSLNTSHIRLK